MANNTLITSPQVVSTINPIQGLIDYVGDVKPYHTKILDVLIEYVYTEQINATVQEQWNMAMTQVGSGTMQLPNPLVSTSIGENFGFDIELFLQDIIATSIVDIPPVGYGMDAYSTKSGGFGSVVDTEGLSITAVGSGNTTFMGSILGSTLTASSVDGIITSGIVISCPAVAANTVIQEQLSGPIGGAGTYVVSIPQTVTATQMSLVSVSTPIPLDGFDQDMFDV